MSDEDEGPMVRAQAALQRAMRDKLTRALLFGLYPEGCDHVADENGFGVVAPGMMVRAENFGTGLLRALEAAGLAIVPKQPSIPQLTSAGRQCANLAIDPFDVTDLYQSMVETGRMKDKP